MTEELARAMTDESMDILRDICRFADEHDEDRVLAVRSIIRVLYKRLDSINENTLRLIYDESKE